MLLIARLELYLLASCHRWINTGTGHRSILGRQLTSHFLLAFCSRILIHLPVFIAQVQRHRAVFRDLFLNAFGLSCLLLCTVDGIDLRLLIQTLPLVGTVFTAIVIKDLHSLLSIDELLQVKCLLHYLVVAALELILGSMVKKIDKLVVFINCLHLLGVLSENSGLLMDSRILVSRWRHKL